MLLDAKSMRSEPTPLMAPTNAYFVTSAFKIVWWLAETWLLAGIVRTILMFWPRPFESRFLQDLCAGEGVIYCNVVMGIIANAFDMALRGLLADSPLSFR
jgi:hypothetical protein